MSMENKEGPEKFSFFAGGNQGEASESKKAHA